MNVGISANIKTSSRASIRISIGIGGSIATSSSTRNNAYTSIRKKTQLSLILVRLRRSWNSISLNAILLIPPI